MMYIICGIISAYLIMNTYIRYETMRMKKMELISKNDRNILNSNFNLSDAHTLIDQYIDESFDKYLIDNSLVNDVTSYINQDEENEMNRTISVLVASRIPSNVYRKLSWYYEESVLIDIINERILYHVLQHRVSHNRYVLDNSEKEYKK